MLFPIMVQISSIISKNVSANPCAALLNPHETIYLILRPDQQLIYLVTPRSAISCYNKSCLFRYTFLHSCPHSPNLSPPHALIELARSSSSHRLHHNFIRSCVFPCCSPLIPACFITSTCFSILPYHGGPWFHHRCSGPIEGLYNFFLDRQHLVYFRNQAYRMHPPRSPTVIQFKIDGCLIQPTV